MTTCHRSAGPKERRTASAAAATVAVRQGSPRARAIWCLRPHHGTAAAKVPCHRPRVLHCPAYLYTPIAPTVNSFFPFPRSRLAAPFHSRGAAPHAALPPQHQHHCYHPHRAARPCPEPSPAARSRACRAQRGACDDADQGGAGGPDRCGGDALWPQVPLRKDSHDGTRERAGAWRGRRGWRGGAGRGRCCRARWCDYGAWGVGRRGWDWRRPGACGGCHCYHGYPPPGRDGRGRVSW